MPVNQLEVKFFDLSSQLFLSLSTSEVLSVALRGEESSFMRINHGLIRQTTHVKDASLELTLYSAQKKMTATIPFCGLLDVDNQTAFKALDELKLKIKTLPTDPFATPPQAQETSHCVHLGDLLTDEEMIKNIVEPAQGLDLVGIYAAGKIFRGLATSVGARHWFATDNFSFDYSIFQDQISAKGSFGGTHWQQDEYLFSLENTKRDLLALNQPSIHVQRGKYRCYLGPQAVSEILSLLNYGALSELSIQNGTSLMALARSQGKHFSPKFNLKENFRLGLSPQFNEVGELSPDTLELVKEGQLKNTFISNRTAQEYGLQSNGATQSESMRSTELAPGHLNEADILKALDTGVYLSNLHYLNWSDQSQGRVTGMTRFACFWVEKGEIRGPIENMRFDVHLYELFGEDLIDLCRTSVIMPDTLTYGERQVRGQKVCGALVNNFHFTF